MLVPAKGPGVLGGGGHRHDGATATWGAAGHPSTISARLRVHGRSAGGPEAGDSGQGLVTLPPSHQLAAERLDLTGTFRIFWFNPPLLQRRKHPKPRRKAPCVNIYIPTQGYRYLTLFRKVSKGGP